MMYKKDLSTGCGMFGLWDYEAYKNIDDYDKWEPLFCEDEDIEKQIERKHFVPVNIHSDGCFGFVLKIDDELNEREQKYVCVKSEEYLLKTSGKVVLSGIEHIDGGVKDNKAVIIDVPAGNYSVTVHLISWEDEEGAYLDNGEINPNALPDFVILLKSNANTDKLYRESINTFSEDD